MLSIDDFGTGYSSLVQLQTMPFTEIKIDRQFIHGCVSSATQRSVVEASLALARSLKMTAVAEGVENRADWDLLGKLGCDVMQGFLFSPALPADQLERTFMLEQVAGPGRLQLLGGDWSTPAAAGTMSRRALLRELESEVAAQPALTTG